MVLADRYIYTLMARDLVRGMDEAWLKNLYGIALMPDAVFILMFRRSSLCSGIFAKKSRSITGSGMDLGLSREMFDSFLKYQGLMARQFQRLASIYGFSIVDGNRPPDEINASCNGRLKRF